MNPKQNCRSLTNEKLRFQTKKYTLHQESPIRWKVSGRDSKGSYRRIRFEALDLSEAIKIAEEKLSQPSAKTHPGLCLRISDALIRSRADRSWTPSTMDHDNAYCRYFLEWIDQQGYRYWHELTLEHMQAYKKTLRDRHLAFDTIRLYFQPVRRTARWAAAVWPREHFDICQSLRVSRRECFNPIFNEHSGKPFLSVHRLLDFLDWFLRDRKGQRTPNKDQIALGICLQGLAGLQLQEAYRLTAEKYSSADNSIIIDGVVKNEFRIRKIPVVGVVLWLLRQARPDQPEARFLSGFATFNEYSQAVARQLRQWDPALVRFKPKDLRNTLQTESIDGGWYGYYVQRYVGHTPSTLGEVRYHGDEWIRILPFLKEKVADRMEELIRSWNAPMDTPVYTGLKLVVHQ